MKQLLLLLFFAGYYTTVNAGKCTRPYLSRQKVYIYSTIGKVPVKISRCLFNDTKDSYSDISNNCIKAFQSGIFVDKWDEKNILEDKFSPIVLEEYVSKADLVKNEVSLRSGRTCRYDRGFCYDPTETNTYAIVWEILEKSKEECPSLLYKVFEGDVDIWDFKPQGLSYLFYYDAFDDEAFYLGMEKKGQCQESDVWYTKEGYVVSVKPLVSKDMEKKASLILPKQGIKGGIKGGVKGGVKGGNKWGKLVERNDEYFSLRTKKTVSELILKNCDIRSLSIQELNEEVDSDYLENPHNLHLILERYYNLIKATKEELLEMIKKQNTLEITKELKEKLITLSQHFDETKLEVKEIQEILAGAGNLKGIRADLDDLAAKVVALLKKHEEYYDVIVKEIQESIKNNSKNINDQSLEIKIFSDKLEEIRNIIGKQIPEFITKTEVYEKINKVEQDFHEKLKDLVMNVTLILLNKDANVGGDGINGKNTERLAMENLIVDKLKSYNVDQFQTALDGLNDKIKLLLEQLRSETNMNVTTVEEKLLKKLADLAAQNEPILARLDKYGDKMNKLFLDIKDFKVNLEEHIVKTDLIAKDTESQIKKIFETFEEYDKFTLEIKKELKALSEKEVDFNPVYEKVHMIIDESLKPIDERLQLLEVISVNLGGYLDKNIEDVGNLTKDINDIRENLTKLDSLKGEINENLQKEVVTIQTKIEDVFNLHEALAKKVSEIDQDLQTSKNIFMSELLNATLMCEGAVMFVNLTALENRDMIEMLKNQNDLALMSFDELKQLVVNQGLALNEIEARSKEDTDKAIAEHDKTNEIINTLKENITDIYDILKFQEDSILILKKSCGKSTKGGYTKGGVKTSSLFNPLRPEATLDYEWGNLGSRSISYTKTKRDVDDNYGDYYEHGHSSALTENDLSLIVETQKTEIKSLRKQLFQTQDTLNKHEQRIEYLEAKIDKLINRRD